MKFIDELIDNFPLLKKGTIRGRLNGQLYFGDVVEWGMYCIGVMDAENADYWVHELIEIALIELLEDNGCVLDNYAMALGFADGFSFVYRGVKRWGNLAHTLTSCTTFTAFVLEDDEIVFVSGDEVLEVLFGE